MAEMRVSHVIVALVLVAGIGSCVLVFVGYLTIPALDLFGWKTPEISQKDLAKAVESSTQTAAGFKPAKTPTEAMDRFREAVVARKYKFAATYTTKSYADMLERSAENAAELGAAIDKVRDYGQNKGFKTDKLTFMLHQLDPFPKNIKSGPAPTVKGDKAYGVYTWEPLGLETPLPTLLQEYNSVDKRMFQRVLSPTLIFEQPIEIVKEGEVWKLNIPTNKPWEHEVGYFNDHWKAYHTGLTSFAGDMLNNRFADKAAFEAEVLGVLRKAK